jgi:hypothetical protein
MLKFHLVNPMVSRKGTVQQTSAKVNILGSRLILIVGLEIRFG